MKHTILAILGGAVVGYMLGNVLWNTAPWATVVDAVVKPNGLYGVTPNKVGTAN